MEDPIKFSIGTYEENSKLVGLVNIFFLIVHHFTFLGWYRAENYYVIFMFFHQFDSSFSIFSLNLIPFLLKCIRMTSMYYTWMYHTHVPVC